MAKLTRRGLIRQTTLGTAAASVFLTVPGRVFARSGAGNAMSAVQAPADAPLDRHEPFAVYVHTPASGELTLLLGTREVVVHDPDLVRRLIQATR